MEDIDGGLHPAVDGQGLDEESITTYMKKSWFMNILKLCIK